MGFKELLKKIKNRISTAKSSRQQYGILDEVPAAVIMPEEVPAVAVPLEEEKQVVAEASPEEITKILTFLEQGKYTKYVSKNGAFEAELEERAEASATIIRISEKLRRLVELNVIAAVTFELEGAYAIDYVDFYPILKAYGKASAYFKVDIGNIEGGKLIGGLDDDYQAQEQYRKKLAMDDVAKEKMANESDLVSRPEQIEEDNTGAPLTVQAQNLASRLAEISAMCSGGVRVLKLDRNQYKWVDNVQGEDRDWLDGIIDKDTTNSNLMCVELNYFATLTSSKELSSVLSIQPTDNFVGGDFTSWAKETRNGSCGEGAAADCARWAALLHKSIPGFTYQSGIIEKAQKIASEEQKKWDEIRSKEEFKAVKLSLPSQQEKDNGYTDIDDAQTYLKKVFKMNKNNSNVSAKILILEWNKIRALYFGVWNTDKDSTGKQLITWEEVFRTK